MTRIRIGLAALLVASPAFGLAAGAAEPAQTHGVPAPLWDAAECMASILRTEPRVAGIAVRAAEGTGVPYPILEYSYVDELGRRRFTELRLFEIPGAQARFIFDRGDIAGDPVAFRALPTWTRRCEVDVGYITSMPGRT